MFKSGFVTVIGKPNAGKSMLVNSMLSTKISIVTPRPQTTRNSIRGILNTDKFQIVFVDTPGIFKAKSNLDVYMQLEIKNSLDGTDVVLYVLDIKKEITVEELKSIEIYAAAMKGKLILAVNKIDIAKDNDIYSQLNKLNNLKNVENIIPVSAKRGKQIQKILDKTFELLPEGEPYYGKTEITDSTEKYLVSEIVREKTLLYIHDEIPHGIAVAVEKFKEKETIIEIDTLIICSKPSHKNIIIGKKGSMLKQIGKSARLDIEKLLGKKVFLNIWVKVDKDWRDMKHKLQDFGYN